MDRDFLQRLFSRDILLAIGVALFVFGIILRGLARDQRRTQARRKEHLRDARKSEDAGLSAQLEQAPGWLEENLGLLANSVWAAGILIAFTSLFRG